jgi:integrase
MSNTPQIRFVGFTDAWEQRKLSEISEKVSKKNQDMVVDEVFTNSAEFGIISQRDYFDKDIANSENIDGYYIVEPNDFVYNPRISTLAPFGPVRRNKLDKSGAMSPLYYVFRTHNVDCGYLEYFFKTNRWHSFMHLNGNSGARSDRFAIRDEVFRDMPISMPQDIAEQKKVGDFFSTLELAITLHQREPPKEDKILNELNNDTLFYEYYCHWLVIYKEGSVRDVTMQKYHLTAEWIKKLIPNVKLRDFDRITYQQLINDYAESHERQTTMDFHHQLKGAILDAVDDGLIVRDPTRKVIIKGKSPNTKKKKYLSRYELQKLLADLDLNSGLNMDWLILLIAKTGMRFSEAIAVTPVDFDFAHQILSVNKTWDYKGEGGFQPTKNKSSIRKIRLDWQTVGQFYAIVREMIDTDPIFVSKEKKIYNSTLNDVLERHCKAVGIPTISVHGLRHTHASLLLFDGVSIASVAQRLGHSSINTTQKTYLHIIRELENKDIDLIMKSISSLLD